MDRWQAQYEFWAQFGVPAYEENSVPDRDLITYPYRSSPAAAGGFGDPVTVTPSIWDRNSSWFNADKLSDQIEHFIRMTNPIKYDDGRMWVYIGETTFSQNMGDPDDDLIKRKVLNVNIEFEQSV